MKELAHAVLAWREANPAFLSGPQGCMCKATEELGEVARALVGELEGRPGRGDVVQEVAQTIIVLLSLAASTHPEADVGEAITAELKRHELGEWVLRAVEVTGTD